MVTLLKRWDGSAYRWVKSVRYRSGAAWSKVIAPRVRVNGIWKPVETRQPAVLIGDGYETRALWHFDTGSGNTCYDSSGHGLNINRVQYAEQPAWATGYFYKALYFTDDRINAPDHGSLYDFTNSDTWQIDVVFKLLGGIPPDNKVLIGYYGGGSNVIWVGTYANTGYLEFYVRDASGNSDYIFGTSNVYDSAWHKASFVRIGGYLKIYLDGNLQTSKNDNNTSGYNIPRFNIGWYSPDFSRYAIDNGYICEIRIIKGGISISSLTGEKVTVYTFTEIGSTSDVFFWAIQEFNGKLYAGTYKETPPSVYNYPPWTHLKDFSSAGESLTDLKVFNNELYAATEKTGQIYKMNTANPTSWSVVYDDGTLQYALDLIVWGGYLYAALYGTNHYSKIIRSANGSNWSQVASWADKFLRYFVIHDNELYVLGRKQSTYKAEGKKTSNGTTWVDAPGLNNNVTGEYHYGESIGGYLWIPMGNRTDNLSKVYKYNGSSLTEVFSVSLKTPHRTRIWDDKLWYTFGPGWKEAGTSSLYMSPTGESGDWQHIKTWSGKSNARALGIFSNKLYIGISNKVYRMNEI